jgi:hypothetical protein
MRPEVSGDSHRLVVVEEGVFCSQIGCISEMRHFEASYY